MLTTISNDIRIEKRLKNKVDGEIVWSCNLDKPERKLFCC